MTEIPSPARIGTTITRRVEWSDTDASGHYHNGVVLRWVEAAEAQLLRELGIDHLFGAAPRLVYHVEFRSRLYFDNELQVRLEVAELTRRSVRYEFAVTAGDTTAVDGWLVAAYVPPTSESAQSWPEDVRSALAATAG